VYIKPAGEYVVPGRETAFATVVEAARRRNEVAIGYRRVDGNGGGGIRINPAKSSRVQLGEQDRVIVLAES
jgi:hypothetical protein